MQTKKISLEKKYSVDNLFHDIVNQYKRENFMFSRDEAHKLKVIKYLMTLVIYIANDNEHDGNAVIDGLLKNDASLFSFMFFISSRSQFDYTWSYLQKQRKEYIKMLKNVCAFIYDMIEKVNVLYEHRSEFKARNFVFADLFVLTINDEIPAPHIEIKWEKMGNLLHLSSGYHLSAKMGETIIMTEMCGYNKQHEIGLFLNHLKSLE